jgi:hypothetical protein
MHDEPVTIHITSDDRPSPLCDFCSSTEIAWRYPCASFDLPEPYRHGSAGDWAACDPCAILIERVRILPGGRPHAADLADLARRPIDRIYPDGPPSAQALLDLGSFLYHLHGGFFRHRTGPRIPQRVPAPVPSEGGHGTHEARPE